MSFRSTRFRASPGSTQSSMFAAAITRISGLTRQHPGCFAHPHHSSSRISLRVKFIAQGLSLNSGGVPSMWHKGLGGGFPQSGDRALPLNHPIILTVIDCALYPH
jgi:hypothetical protein